MRQDGTANALLVPNGGRGDVNVGAVAGAMGVRRLTPLECERLQAFPDEWTRLGVNEAGETYEIADTHRYRMLGNAVTVSVPERIFNRLMEGES